MLERRDPVRPRSWITYRKREQKRKRIRFQPNVHFFTTSLNGRMLLIWSLKTKKIHLQRTLFKSSFLRICPAATFISPSCLSLPSAAKLWTLWLLCYRLETLMLHIAWVMIGLQRAHTEGKKYRAQALGTWDITFNGLFVSCERKKEKKKKCCAYHLCMFES